MKLIRTLCTMGILSTMTACGGGGGSDTPSSPSSTFSVTLTGVEIDRVADQQDITVDSLPLDGATVTVK